MAECHQPISESTVTSSQTKHHYLQPLNTLSSLAIHVATPANTCKFNTFSLAWLRGERKKMKWNRANPMVASWKPCKGGQGKSTTIACEWPSIKKQTNKSTYPQEPLNNLQTNFKSNHQANHQATIRDICPSTHDSLLVGVLVVSIFCSPWWLSIVHGISIQSASNNVVILQMYWCALVLIRGLIECFGMLHTWLEFILWYQTYR